MTKKIILVGASSDLAREVSIGLSEKFDVINLSRKPIADNRCTNVCIQDYSTIEINKFLSTLDKVDAHTFIFFNGMSDSEIFVNISEDEIHSIVNTNLIAPILFTKACLKKFIPKKNNYIYLTSTRALNGDRGIALYSTTKSALKFLTRSLALEYGKFNQIFHTISLGIFDCGLIKMVNKNTLDRVTKNSALNGYVDTQELCRAIAYIVHSEASTGSVLHIDNGYF
jgi:3-oxoacyl-[acyl-carrier protein] reductase